MSTTSSERTKLGYGLREEEGEDFWLFGALATIKISAKDTAGQYCVIDVEVPPGVGSPWHVHREEDEWFFVHEGDCEVYIGDAHLTLTAGGFAFGPKGVLPPEVEAKPMFPAGLGAADLAAKASERARRAGGADG